MPQLDLTLAPQNDARRATILSLPAQIEADVLPRDVGDADYDGTPPCRKSCVVRVPAQ
jgi:hypothetical protein